MDLSFIRRDRTAARPGVPARLDYGMLVATLGALQASCPTARAEAQLRGRDGHAHGRLAALVELLLGGPAWQAGVAAQCGSFNRALAERLAGAEA